VTGPRPTTPDSPRASALPDSARRDPAPPASGLPDSARPAPAQPAPPRPAVTAPAQPRPAVPRVVAWAALLLIARIALGLVGAAGQLANGGPIRAAIQATNPTVGAAEADRVYLIVVALAVGYGLLYAAGYAVLAVQLWRGRSWALPTVRLVTGLGVLAGLGSLAGTAPFGRSLGAVLLLLDAVTFCLLATRRARPHPAPAE
jgi:hypothetical protein